MRGKTIAVLYGLVAVSGWPLSLHAEDALPGEVLQFIEQRTLCDHMREEPWPEGDTPEEQERRVFLSAQRERFCTGSDERLRRLRERYRDNPGVIKRLAVFEGSVE